MSERLKYELADELGFSHKVKDGDWGNITTREAGSWFELPLSGLRSSYQREQDLTKPAGGHPNLGSLLAPVLFAVPIGMTCLYRRTL